MNQLKSLIKEVERLNKIVRNPKHKCFQIAVAQLRAIRKTVEVVDNDFDLMGEGFDEHKKDWQTLKKLLGIK